MTNKQAVISSLGQITSFNNDALTRALSDAGIDPDIEYDKANTKAIDLVAVKVLRGINITSLTEGGYSVTFSQSAIDAQISYLLAQSGQGGVRDMSHLW